MCFEVVYDESIGELEEVKYGLIIGKLIFEVVDYFYEVFSVRFMIMFIKL